MFLSNKNNYRSGTVNSNMVNSEFHLIQSNCEIFFYNFPNILCLKCTVKSNFYLIRSKTLLTNDFELTVPNLYATKCIVQLIYSCFYLLFLPFNISLQTVKTYYKQKAHGSMFLEGKCSNFLPPLIFIYMSTNSEKLGWSPLTRQLEVELSCWTQTVPQLYRIHWQSYTRILF